MRLIDVDELAKELSKRVWYKQEDEKQAVRIVKEFPTVDAVPVVRCRECKWYCEYYCGWRQIIGELPEDFYCADGDRKGGVNDAAD